MAIDKRKMLESEAFSYQITKEKKVRLFYKEKDVKMLSGNAAMRWRSLIMLKKQVIVTLLLVSFVILVAVLYTTFVYGKATDIEQISLSKIEISPYFMIIEGGTTSSALSFAGYSLSTEDHVAYLKLRYALSSFVHPEGNFVIEEGVLFENINELYLVDSSGGKKLIWHMK